jgi:hypothetical protein
MKGERLFTANYPVTRIFSGFTGEGQAGWLPLEILHLINQRPHSFN